MMMMMFLTMVFFSWQSRMCIADPQERSLTAIPKLTSNPINCISTLITFVIINMFAGVHVLIGVPLCQVP